MTKSPAFATRLRGRWRSALIAAPAVLLASAGTAFAQAAPAAGGEMGGVESLLLNLMPIILLVVIFWFLIFRPQQKRAKQQQEMLKAIRRGDTVVTTGGLVGKVTKAADGEDLEVEIAPNTRVRVVRHMVADVRSKGGESSTETKPA